MIKNLFTGLLLLCGLSSLANADNLTQHPGVLQAYWLPVFNDDGSQAEPELLLRFLDTSNAQKKIVVDLYKERNADGPQNSVFGKPEDIARIRHDFATIPDNFFRFKEGHIEQNGVLTQSGFFSQVECDHRYYYAKFVAFKPVTKSGDYTQEIGELAGCGGQPWQVGYQVNPAKGKVYLKARPDMNSQNLVPLTTDDSVIKIRTIDAEWLYVAVYDAGKPDSMSDRRGYIRKSALTNWY